MSLPLAEEAALPAKLGPWGRWPRSQSAGLAHRERAWKVLSCQPKNPHPALSLSTGPGSDQDGSLVLQYDFGTEVLGRPTIRFKAAAGTILDVAGTERLKEDGTADLFCNHFVTMVDRYIARDGEQTYQTFHPRGLRYLEVCITGDLSQFEFLDVGLTRANYPAQEMGRFECSDPLLNEIWATGQRTLIACMEDSYLDCPWRERGLYSGDLLVEFFVNLATFGDVKLCRRCIDLFLQPRGNSGHASLGHGDYSAIVIHSAWHYWAHSGDVQFLREVTPRLKEVLAKLQARLQASGGELVDATTMHPYIDLCHMDKGGINCAVNCFYQQAFHRAGQIMELVGDRESALVYAAQAEKLAAAIRRTFWDDQRGVFTDRPAATAGIEPSVPANALPIIYGIATPQQMERAGKWLAQAMLNNFRVPEPKTNDDLNVNAYFSFYAIGALYRCGKALEAEQFMRQYWGRMLDGGAWTWWEYFLDTASRCHAWSGAPTHYLSTQVLGVSFPDPGNLRRVQIRPTPGTLSWAQGIYPHPDGPIRVKWEMRNGHLVMDYHVPAGVEVV